MQHISTSRCVSQVFLWAFPLPPILMLAYRPGGLTLYAIAGAILVLLMAVAVWILVADSMKGPATDRRTLLLPGVLLVAGWASVALAVCAVTKGMRYIALLVAGLLAWAAFGLLSARLREAGEHTFSVLGLAAATISMGLFTLSTLAALALYDTRALQGAISGNALVWWHSLFAFSLSCFGVFTVLTHLAAGLYAVALGNVGLLGKFGCALFVVLSTIAVALALIVVSGGNPILVEALYVFMSPAVPLIPPYLIGVNLVRRAGDTAS